MTLRLVPYLISRTKSPASHLKYKAIRCCRGVIYPQAFREVLRRLIDDPPDSELKWAQGWYALINALTDRDLLEDEPDDDESEGVIADIVNAFCAVHQFATVAANYDEVTA